MSDIPLQIDGYTEHSGDWKLAPLLLANKVQCTERECDYNAGPQDNAAKFADVLASSSDLVYSWGFRTIYALGNVSKPKKLFFAVLAVGDNPLDGSGVPAPSNYDKCVCIQITEAFPKSKFFNDKDAVWFDINDAGLLKKIINGPRVINISAKSLWPDWSVNGIEMHTNTQNDKRVLALGLWLVKTYDPPAET